MDRLSDLPPNETELTPDEKNVMDKFFGQANNEEKVEAKPAKTTSWVEIMKLALYATALFVFLSNPLTDGILCRLPYCSDNGLTLTAFKSLLFMILFLILIKYAL